MGASETATLPPCHFAARCTMVRPKLSPPAIFPASGGLGKEIKYVSEFAFLKLNRIIGNCINPDDCRWLELRLQIFNNCPFHSIYTAQKPS